MDTTDIKRGVRGTAEAVKEVTPRVKSAFTRLGDYVRESSTGMWAFLNRYPALQQLVGLWLLFSAVPLSGFALFTLGTFVTTSAMALTGVLTVNAVVITASSFVLGGILLVTGLASCITYFWFLLAAIGYTAARKTYNALLGAGSGTGPVRKLREGVEQAKQYVQQ